MKHLYRYLLFCLLLVSLQGIAQSFTTQVSSRAIGKKDLVQVDYIAENLELSDFKLPKFLGWAIQSGPNFSSNQVMSGNQVTQKIIYSFLLMPLRTGKLSIPSATITIDKNNSRQSNTVTVDVKDVDHIAGNSITAAPQPPSLFDEPDLPQDDFSKEQVLRKGEIARDKIKNNLLIKLDVNKTSCFVGEPIIATYKLCTRLRSQSRVVKQPAFNGCTVTELTAENPTAKRETINGRMYNVYVIRKVQLYPLQEGTLVLPEASVENTVSFLKAEGLNFRDLYYDHNSPNEEETQITLSNKPVSVTVKALPPDAPANFNGAVGKFRIGAIPADEKPIMTRNTSNLLVAIEGEGNLEQIKAPAIVWPQGIEGFDPVQKDETDNSGPVVRVRKTFTYPFVVNKPGNYTIPPVQLIYFNPETGKYMNASSKPISFKAQKGNNIFSAISSTSDNADFQTRLYLILGGALLAIAIGLLVYNRKHKAKPAAMVKKPEPAVVKPLEPAVSDFEYYIHNIRSLNPIENRSFYKQLHLQVSEYLKAKYNIAPSDIDAAARTHPADVDTLLKVKSLLNDCSLGMYTPMFNTEEELKHRLLAIELLSKLEKRSELI